jgi:predicted RNase H-like HicB family nuclease
MEKRCIIGRIKEVPGVFSQGQPLEELEENVRDAFRLMTEEDSNQDATPFIQHIN